MRKLLIITYYWPPASGPGVQRFLKMAKYFPEFGWQPFILTTEDGTYPSTDYSLLDDVSDQTTVYRTRPKESFGLYNKITGKKGKNVSVGFIGMDNRNPIQKLALYIRANYFVPDARMGWNKTALPKAEEIIEKEGIDTIITTGPPQSTHLLGLQLKKKYGVRWVADFRDPWVNVYYNKIFPRTKRTISKDQRLENDVLRWADAVTVVSPGLKREFEDRAREIKVVYNGYDSADFKSLQKERSDDFVISYIGNFKSNQDVPVFWQTLSDLTFNKKEERERLRIRLTGNIHPTILDTIDQFGLTPNLELNPFVSHDEAVDQMINSDRLLFIIPKVEDNELILTGKLFEYLASETQMISIGPEKGDAAEILRTCKRIPMMDYADMNTMRERIFRNRVNGVSEDYKVYTRKNQAKAMVELL